MSILFYTLFIIYYQKKKILFLFILYTDSPVSLGEVTYSGQSNTWYLTRWVFYWSDSLLHRFSLSLSSRYATNCMRRLSRRISSGKQKALLLVLCWKKSIPRHRKAIKQVRCWGWGRLIIGKRMEPFFYYRRQQPGGKQTEAPFWKVHIIVL